MGLEEDLDLSGKERDKALWSAPVTQEGRVHQPHQNPAGDISWPGVVKNRMKTGISVGKVVNVTHMSH